MLREFCAENFTDVPEAIEKGASRIELCDQLAVGGTTPTVSVQEKTITYAHDQNATVVVMIRPRGGEFVYTPAEKETMLAAAKQALTLGADGIVCGALTETGSMDKPFLEKLKQIVGEKEIVFHMAFDFIPPAQQYTALDWLIDTGYTRVLTRGGKTGSAIENAERINEYVAHCQGEIEILPGGGLTVENLAQAKEKLNVDQFHGTKIV
ncbi:copper homeostasis protein CutC [Lacticigenium naphthae]|uniref:copper homeostasis protein CutC n=1 Tax=Lacticigenium naphthae TaxID=515351 RepID=UPI00041DF578|nr:copper homeostasis protein CutC [Lacticigenium naphthae]